MVIQSQIKRFDFKCFAQQGRFPYLEFLLEMYWWAEVIADVCDHTFSISPVSLSVFFSLSHCTTITGRMCSLHYHICSCSLSLSRSLYFSLSSNLDRWALWWLALPIHNQFISSAYLLIIVFLCSCLLFPGVGLMRPWSWVLIWLGTDKGEGENENNRGRESSDGDGGMRR